MRANILTVYIKFTQTPTFYNRLNASWVQVRSNFCVIQWVNIISFKIAWVSGLPEGLGERRFLDGGGGRGRRERNFSSLPFSLPSFPFPPETPDTQATFKRTKRRQSWKKLTIKNLSRRKVARKRLQKGDFMASIGEFGEAKSKCIQSNFYVRPLLVIDYLSKKPTLSQSKLYSWNLAYKRPRLLFRMTVLEFSIVFTLF